MLRPVQEGASPSLYLEPHVEFDEDELRALAPVDAVITPTRGQALPGFELVHGPAAAVRLVETLRPRLVLPMSNGAIDAAGIAAPLVTPIGAGNEFERLLRAGGGRRRRGGARGEAGGSVDYRVSLCLCVSRA